MNIYVLEDDFIQQTRMETVITELLAKHGIEPTSFQVFGKPQQLLAAAETKGTHQLFFLDIEIKSEELKGLEVAREIRKMNPYATIVFVTTHSEFMPLSFRYQVSALDYIEKEISPEKFEKQIETALLYANEQIKKSISEDSFFCQTKYTKLQLPFNEVYFIETSPRAHRVILHSMGGRTEFTANLSEIAEKEKRMLHCHRSFLINPANVTKFDKKEKMVYFPNGLSCFVARNKVEAVADALDKLH